MTVVAILGGGHQGYAVAGDLAYRGYEVRLWRRSPDRFGCLADHRRLTLHRGDHRSEGVLAVVTGDLEAAVRGAEIVIVAIPATGHHVLAADLAPVVDSTAIVMLTPGNFGSIEFAAAFAAAGRGGVAVAETSHPPFGARKRSATAVGVAHPTIRLPVGVLPARRTDEVLEALRRLYPQLLAARDVLDAALCNPNPVIHPALMVTNAGPIEALDRYDIHAMGTTPATMRVIRSVDAERVQLRERLGYGEPHWDVGTLYDADRRGTGFFPSETFATVTESGDWNEPLTLTSHRYLDEDAGCGLAVWRALARGVSVPTPTIDALLNLGSTLTATDLAAVPGALAWVGVDRDHIVRLVSRGWETT